MVEESKATIKEIEAYLKAVRKGDRYYIASVFEAKGSFGILSHSGWKEDLELI